MRVDDAWEASSVDLDDANDIDDVLEELRELGPDADVVLLFVEADDEYLAVLRFDGGDDLRVFCSDAEFADVNRMGAMLLSETELNAEPEPDLDDDAEPTTTELDAQPVGEFALLTDLGVSAATLKAVCAKDGMLPSDITAEIATRIGCGDVLEEVHDA